MDVSKISLIQVLNTLITFFLIFVSVFVGSFIKKQYQIVQEKTYNYKLSYLLITSLPTSLLIFSISDLIMKKVTLPMFIFICFLLGTSSSIFVDKFFNGTFLLVIARIFLKVKQDTVDIIVTTVIEKEKDKKDDKEKKEDSNDKPK